MLQFFTKITTWVLIWGFGATSGVYVTDLYYNRELSYFEYVCQELTALYPESSCADLAEPIVITSAIIDDAAGRWARWYGVYYHGEIYIFVNPDNTPEQTEQTIIHEMVHYVVWHNDLPPKDDVCENERVARVISGGTWTELEQGYYGC